MIRGENPPFKETSISTPSISPGVSTPLPSPATWGPWAPLTWISRPLRSQSNAMRRWRQKTGRVWLFVGPQICSDLGVDLIDWLKGDTLKNGCCDHACIARWHLAELCSFLPKPVSSSVVHVMILFSCTYRLNGLLGSSPKHQCGFVNAANVIRLYNFLLAYMTDSYVVEFISAGSKRFWFGVANAPTIRSHWWNCSATWTCWGDFHRQAFPSTVLANWVHEVSKGQGWGWLYEKHGPQHMTRQSVRMSSSPSNMEPKEEDFRFWKGNAEATAERLGAADEATYNLDFVKTMSIWHVWLATLNVLKKNHLSTKQIR